MKNIDREIVGKVARALIVLNGKTTNLDVKNQLRKMGYWAKQDAVREFMLDITSKDGDVVYSDANGMFREYSFRSTTFDDMDANYHETDAISDAMSCGDMFCDESECDCGKFDLSTDLSQGFSGGAVDDGDADLDSLHSALKQLTDIVQNEICYDNIPAKYRVYKNTSGVMADFRTYENVTRAQAKANWARETGNDFLEARTIKVTETT